MRSPSIIALPVLAGLAAASPTLEQEVCRLMPALVARADDQYQDISPVMEPRDVIPQAIQVINKWRGAYKLPLMDWAEDLAINAYNTAQANKGVLQDHDLPPYDGALKVGQVIAPGNSAHLPSYGALSPFEVAYLSWLCEVPTDPEIESVCPQAVAANKVKYCTNCSSHHDLLLDPAFIQIGCGFFQNPTAPPGSTWNGVYVCSTRSK